MFSYFAVIRLTYYHIIMVIRAILDGFIIGNIKGSITGTRKYFVVKRTLFAFRKKFVITDNRRKYC